MSNRVEKLREDIDTGRTGDKVRHADPAAAPLGADEEAAGTPLSTHAVETARRYEVSGPAKTNEDGGTSIYIMALAALAVVFVGAVLVFLR
jgi:hypothetical protein